MAEAYPGASARGAPAVGLVWSVCRDEAADTGLAADLGATHTHAVATDLGGRVLAETRADAQTLAQQARSGGRDHVTCILLTRAAAVERVADRYRRSAGVWERAAAAR